MYLSFIDIFDLFMRFLTVGQLSLLSLYMLSQNRDLKTLLGVALAICLGAYILLTTPIENQHYGLLRGVLLFLTEFVPYILWCLALILLKDDFQPSNWPNQVKVVIGFVTLWFIYFFGYLQGKGVFHQVNHVLQFIPLLHIIFLSIKDLADDLVNARRNVRLIFITLICVYFCFILLLEVGESSMKTRPDFSLLNALFVLFCTSTFSWMFFNKKLHDSNASVLQTQFENESQIRPEPVVPQVYAVPHQQLMVLMDEGFYKESLLTIKSLSNQLAIPEHQLRELINKHLGFRNFSEFLNSYRIPDACAQLEDLKSIRTPVLTIALTLGYGSVGTFNRAFKLKMGKTPKEYRIQFQK
jgi:AraC-like DNA-binding protein